MSTPATPISRKGQTKTSVFDFHIDASEKLEKDAFDEQDAEYRRGPGSSAEGWAQLSQTMTRYDEVKIKDCKEDMDTLLVFAGLFSAVLTAFVIELYRALQVDPNEMTFLIVTQISQQLNSFSINSGFVNSTHPFLLTAPHFQPSASSIRINVLWFCSLVCSLVTASLAMLVKQWLREYQSQENISPLSRSRIRYWRNLGLVQFRVLEIAAFLPLLLQLALILFFAGLCLFLQDLNPTVGWVVTAFIMAWFVLYVTTTVAPTFSSRCPYKTPLLKEPIQSIRHMIYKPNRDTGVNQHDERFLRGDNALDIPTLVAADAALQDDDFLDKTIRICLAESGGIEVERCVSQIIASRSGSEPKSLAKLHVQDLEKLSSTARTSIVHILLDSLDRELDRRERDKQPAEWSNWMWGSIHCIGSVFLPVYVHLSSTTSEGQRAQIGQSRAGDMLVRLLSQNDIVAKGTLNVLAYPMFSRLPSSFNVPRITSSQALMNLIAGARDCMANDSLDPTRLCQVVLCLATYFEEERLREEWYSLQKLITELAAAIQQKWDQSPGYPRDVIQSAYLAVDHSNKLNSRDRRIAGKESLDILNRLMTAARS